MTTNKPMTGEQLDELMSVAVRMQRDTEVACDFPSANFAYAVQVAVLELRRTRDTTAALAAENASLKQFPEQIIGFIGKLGTSEIGSSTREAIESAAKRIKTPATDAFLAEVRAGAIEEFMEKSLWDTVDCLHGIGAFDKASDREEVQGMIRDELKERVSEFAAQLRQEAAQ